MRRRHNRAADEAGIDMTPMLDVTFILLIFFIVTTSFVSTAGITVGRPSSNPNQVEKKSNSKPIVIRIAANGTIQMNNRQIDIAAIQDNVQSALAGNSDATVIVVANGGAGAGLMVTAIDQARAAGAKNVSIATTGSNG
ncbi:MAG TPA: biopolymer transporter ExbD [Gammaproteobacteria bacterium]|nr:biopolymer transporter ExbD [Gammaproteobacteria bacterium]